MWDNRQDKTNPKAPDWKCQDKTCKWRYNEKSQAWEPSDFQTGVWEKSTPAPKTNVYPVKPQPKKAEPDWDAIAEGKIRHGLVVAMITAGWDEDKITARVPFWVKYIQGEHPEIPF